MKQPTTPLEEALHRLTFNAEFRGIHLFKSAGIRQKTLRKGEPAELIIMLEGVYRARVGNGKNLDTAVEAKVGQTVFWPAGCQRVEENDPSRPMRCYSLYLHWPGGPTEPAPTLVEDSHHLIRSLAAHLLALAESRLPLSPAIAEVMTNAIVAEFVRLATVPSDPLEVKVLAYLSSHRNEPCRLQDIARHIGLEPHHFSRIFRKRTGYSPMDYVRRRRLFWACSLMRSVPHLPLAEVAQRVGIREESELRRQLRRYTSLSMRNLRKVLQNPDAPLPPLLPYGSHP